MVNNNIFYNAMNQDITMVKGDTLSFNFQIDGMGADEFDQITFTVKENPNDAEALFSINFSDEGITKLLDEENHLIYTLRVPPDKTATLTPGAFYYDLVAEHSGDVLTFMRGRLILNYSVKN